MIVAKKMHHIVIFMTYGYYFQTNSRGVPFIPCLGNFDIFGQLRWVACERLRIWKCCNALASVVW